MLLELEEKVSECLHVHDDTAVLQCFLDVYGARIESELQYFFQPSVLAGLSTEDIIRLLDVIVAFNELFKSIHEEKQGHLLKIKVESYLLGAISIASKAYIMQLNRALNLWIDRIVQRIVTQSSLTDSDTRLANETKTSDKMVGETYAAVDILNMVDDVISLSIKSGLLPIQGATLICCLLGINKYHTSLLTYISLVAVFHPALLFGSL